LLVFLLGKIEFMQNKNYVVWSCACCYGCWATLFLNDMVMFCEFHVHEGVLRWSLLKNAMTLLIQVVALIAVQIFEIIEFEYDWDF